MYCLNMLAIALELAREDSAYEDVASKFFEHFVYICRAMNNIGGRGSSSGTGKRVLLRRPRPAGRPEVPDEGPLRWSASSRCSPSRLSARTSSTASRLQAAHAVVPREPAGLRAARRDRYDFRRPGQTVLSLVDRTRLKQICRYLLDESEFLSPHGIRAVSRYHRDNPYVLDVMGTEHRVDYEPAESSTGLFGGNSNWRGRSGFPSTT
jgi:hypothetical protein